MGLAGALMALGFISAPAFAHEEGSPSEPDEGIAEPNDAPGVPHDEAMGPPPPATAASNDPAGKEARPDGFAPAQPSAPFFAASGEASPPSSRAEPAPLDAAAPTPRTAQAAVGPREPIMDALVMGIALTAIGNAGGIGLAQIALLGRSCGSGHDGCGDAPGAPPEAAVPLVGPFVALGRYDLPAGHQATLGILGALQIIGLPVILAGSLLERSVDPDIAFRLDVGPSGARVDTGVSW